MPTFVHVKTYCVWINILLSGAVCFFGAESVQAQNVPDPLRAMQGAEQIQSQIQQRQQMDRDDLSRRPQIIKQLPPPANTPEAEERASAGKGCNLINDIVLTGANQLLFRDKDALTSAYLGRCLNAKDIEQLMTAITLMYVQRGYITTRAYLPRQDLSFGKMEVKVVEGVIEGFELGNTSQRTVNTATAFPGFTGSLLNLRDIEQGEDQANSLASNHVTTQIVPGKEVGGSIVTVNNTPDPPWHTSLSYDNLGVSGTGKTEVSASVGLDNPLNLNDSLSVSRRQSLPEGRIKAYSESETVGYTLPYGYDTFSVGYLRTIYDRQLVQPSGKAYEATGTSVNKFVKWDKLFYRNQSSRFNLSTTLSVKPARNYFAEQLLPLASPRLTVLDLNLAWRTTLLSGLFSIDLTESRGLGIWGALHDVVGQESNYPSAQFHKSKITLQYNRGFKLANYAGDWSTQFNFQHSGDVLYSSEQMLIGGIYTVRGFSSKTLSGEDGFYLRNDVGMHLPATVAGVAMDIKPYAAIDVGHVSQRYTGLAPGGTLMGVAVGVVVSSGHSSVDVFFTHSLRMPDAMKSEGGAVYLKLMYAI